MLKKEGESLDKSAVREVAQKARQQLEEMVQKNLSALHACRLSGDDAFRRDILLKEEEQRGTLTLCKKAAYRFFRELIAVRYMELNGYLPYRVLSSQKSDTVEPDFLAHWLLTHQDTLDRDALFTKLFQKTCLSLASQMPDYFPVPDEMDLLLSLSYRKGVVRTLCDGLSEEEWLGQVELIGWLYQSYHLQEKNAAIDLYAGKVKMKNLTAATQFFTTDWVVRYMVENSLGRVWLEGHPESRLRREMPYYLDLPEETKRVPMEPRDLKILDPCMGGGHILVYAFELLLKIYSECGVPPKRAASLILQDNLYGLDIDERSRELTAFALLMKARSCDPDIFEKGVILHFAAIHHSRKIDKEALHYASGGNEALYDDLQKLTAAFYYGDQFGSILNAPKVDLKALKSRFSVIRGEQYPDNLFRMEAQRKALQELWPLVCQAEIMGQKYTCVVTNPPYLNHMDKPLRNYVDKNFPDYNNDLFAVFMVHNFDFCKEDGYCAFMTPFVWMFIKSYESLRRFLIQEKSVSSLIQMEYSAFEEATVPLCSFVLQNQKEKYPGVYLRLTDYKGGMEEQKKRVLYDSLHPDSKDRFEASLKDFGEIPGMPFAYWADRNVGRAFREGAPLGKVAQISNGLFTCNNQRFLRFWYEVEPEEIDFWCEDESDCRMSGKRWFPYNKGGAFRKWYGNQLYVVDFADFGRDICAYRVKSGQSAAMPGRQNYFQPSLSWSFVSSSTFGVRYYPKGFVFDIAGSSIFPPKEDRLYRLGFLNSSTAFQILGFLNPTLNYQAGNLALLPILESSKKEQIWRLVQRNIDLCKADWDDHEISWNFNGNPLLKTGASTLQEAVKIWSRQIEDRREELRQNEEKINRHFADLYQIGAPVEVENKALSIAPPEPEKAMKELASYFVGLLFGRYREDHFQVKSVSWDSPCKIASAFSGFLEKRFGETAVPFAASFLGRETAEKGLETYFEKKFFAEHCRLYHKRPIYWQMKSGEKEFVYYHGDVWKAFCQIAESNPQSEIPKSILSSEIPLDRSLGISQNYESYQEILRKIP